ncbi:MAG TPA: hypothetical protein VGR56_01695 [Nitrososphaerales archaeon]|nr:hypothetical protein [Nitrososphaerales archaeon]
MEGQVGIDFRAAVRPVGLLDVLELYGVLALIGRLGRLLEYA